MSGKSKLHQLGRRDASAEVLARLQKLAPRIRAAQEALGRTRGFGDAASSEVDELLGQIASELEDEEAGVDGEGERSGETSDGSDPQEA